MEGCGNENLKDVDDKELLLKIHRHKNSTRRNLAGDVENNAFH